MPFIFALCVLFSLTGSDAFAQSPTTPADYLGRPLGVDFELADWNEVKGYYERLAAQSPRVRLQRLGETTEGRDFLLAVISSEENQQRLDAIRDDSMKISDPRGVSSDERARLIAEAKPIVLISIAMHSTETAAPQFGMEFAWRLATSNEEPYRSARENLVVGIFPCLNPDGLDHVVSWYRQNVGTPYEAAGLLKLYQFYAGHDNNRDWFMLSQNETRLVTEQLYSVWRPQVYWDVHQQGGSGERMFVPPFRDPLNPNLDPAIIAGINTLGTRAQFDMTARGLTGVATGITYDMWWNGGNRNVPVRHNIIGILTEAASVKIASPVFLEPESIRPPSGSGPYLPQNNFPAPWPGGWWRLRDIIDYELGFGESLLGSLAREPSTWVRNAIEAAERSISNTDRDGPRGWILPATNRDKGALRRLVDVLLRTGVEMSIANEPFSADEREWPAGSIVISRDQPYGNHVKDLFEVQRYPAGSEPYDVAGWSLPLLLGLRRVEVMTPFEVASTPIVIPDAAIVTSTSSSPSMLDSRDSDSWRTLFQRLSAGEDFELVTEGASAGTIHPRDEIVDSNLSITLPRIGLYSPWSGSMDEGWMRWVLDTYGVPYERVTNEMVRAGELDQFIDVLLIASISARQLNNGRAEGSIDDRYALGLEPEGNVAIDQFVRGGGRLVTTGSSSRHAIDLFNLPLRDVTSADGFSCPGSVLRGVPASGVGANAGLPASIPLFFSRSSAYDLGGQIPGLTPLLNYSQAQTLLSGYIAKPDVIAGKSAWVRADIERGTVHLFGFRPHYRSWSQGCFQLLFRAILFRD